MTTPYKDIRKAINTGDIVLFDGKGLASWLIKRATLSDISHAGMFFKINDDIFIWESTSLYKGSNGVQLNLASTRIETYNGKVYYRPLVCDRPHIFYEVLHSLREELKGKKYEQNIWELMGAALPWRNKENLNTIFCSELIAHAYQRLGLLPNKPASNEYVPNDFNRNKLADEWLIPSARLGGITRLK